MELMCMASSCATCRFASRDMLISQCDKSLLPLPNPGYAPVITLYQYSVGFHVQISQCMRHYRISQKLNIDLRLRRHHELSTFTFSFTCLNVNYQGRSQDLAGGGGQEILFSDLEICAMRFARGVRGHAPPRKFC